MTTKIAIHSTGTGACALTGKEESDGLTVTFEDGTLRESFLSWKGFRQLLALKSKQVAPRALPAATVVAPVAPKPQTALPENGNP